MKNAFIATSLVVKPSILHPTRLGVSPDISPYFRHCFLVFNIVNNKFFSFASIMAIMKICDHSEVIGEIIILKTNAWKMTTRITQKQTFT